MPLGIGRRDTPAQQRVVGSNQANMGIPRPMTPAAVGQNQNDALAASILGATRADPPQTPNTGTPGVGAVGQHIGRRFGEIGDEIGGMLRGVWSQRGSGGIGPGVGEEAGTLPGVVAPSNAPATTPASGGVGVSSGENNPTASTNAPLPQVDIGALQGAVQAGGSATNMGYWQAGDGPRNFLPGTQAASGGISVMPMGGAGTAPSPAAAGAYRPGVDPMHMNPDRGPQQGMVTIGGYGLAGGEAPQGGAGGVDRMLQRAISDYQRSARRGGGSQRGRSTAGATQAANRNIMETLAQVAGQQTGANATIQAAQIGADSRMGVAGIGADAGLTQTQMQQTGQDRRSEAELGLRQMLGEADLGIRRGALALDQERFEAGQGMDPFDAQRMQMMDMAIEMGLPFETVYNMLLGESITPEPYTLDAGTQVIGQMTPSGLGGLTPQQQLLLEQQTRR